MSPDELEAGEYYWLKDNSERFLIGQYFFSEEYKTHFFEVCGREEGVSSSIFNVLKKVTRDYES